MSDSRGVHPNKLPVVSAAQRSSAGRTAASEQRVKVGPLQQQLVGQKNKNLSAKQILYTVNKKRTSIQSQLL